MRYVSTRNKTISKSFEEAICTGYAPDGGLFVPSHLPRITPTILQSWSKLPFHQLASNFMRMFISIDEISDEDLGMICFNSFEKGFLLKDSDIESDDESIIPVVRVGDKTFVAELFHGPTFCFKDFGMRAVVNILSHFATKRNKHITLLVSTTGDTGPAAVQAVSDAANPLLNLLVHYPDGQISSLQRRQLTTVQSPNVHVVAFQGGGDDMDAPIKNVLSSSRNEKDATLSGSQNDYTEHLLCGINSYNIGRPLFQMVHFIWTYLRVVEQLKIEPGDDSFQLDYIIPTGAMGNIAGAYMAKKIGLPIGKLCAGTNINDITYRVITTGKFHKSAAMEKTLSEALNIQVPYNFERILYYLSDENDHLVNQSMSSMITSNDKLDLDTFLHEKLRNEFKSERITDDEMCLCIKNAKECFNYWIDPHTAVAFATAEKLGYLSFSEENQSITNSSYHAIMATASCCKFQESMTVALGENGWEEYFLNERFPKRAKILLEMTEIEPTFYPWIDGKTLEEVQSTWEKMALKIIQEKFGQ